MKPICEIPQASETYAYFEGEYPIINEHGVGMSESTCSGMFAAKPATMGGDACLGIINLGEIALERTKTAREAVKMMGDMAVKYGFYGGASFEGGAESLLVNDKEDVWIFHVLPDNTLKSAIWAAQRIPPDHVTVIANMFTIREIDFDDTENFLFSESVRDVAKKMRWWSPGEPFDFTKIYSNGEYSHKYYSGRRMWGSYLKWGLETDEDYKDLRYDLVYPVSAKPLLPNSTDIRNLFKTYRWSYEGTKYDMASGLAAGPWGITDRWNNNYTIKGNWERSIAVYRTDYLSFAQVSAKKGAFFWYGPHCAKGTVFVPLKATCSIVPASYSSRASNPTVLNRQSAYWAHKYNFNIAYRKMTAAMSEIILKHAESFENTGLMLVERHQPCHAFYDNMDQVWKASWALPDLIMATFADGWYKDEEGAPYPDWWLKAVGYPDGPPPPPKEPFGPCYPHKCPKKRLLASMPDGTKDGRPGPWDQGSAVETKAKGILSRDHLDNEKLVAGPSYFELLALLEASETSTTFLRIVAITASVIACLTSCVAVKLYCDKSSKVRPEE
jgi:dipeptidase